MTGRRRAAVTAATALVTGPANAQANVLFMGTDPADVRLARDVIGDAGHHNFHLVRTAEQATDFLRRRDPFQEVPRPALILIDVDLADGGKDVLRMVKSDRELSSIPVIVLSPAPEASADAYALGANCVVPRPAVMDDYFTVVQAIQRFWLGTALLDN